MVKLYSLWSYSIAPTLQHSKLQLRPSQIIHTIYFLLCFVFYLKLSVFIFSQSRCAIETTFLHCHSSYSVDVNSCYAICFALLKLLCPCCTAWKKRTSKLKISLTHRCGLEEAYPPPPNIYWIYWIYWTISQEKCFLQWGI